MVVRRTRLVVSGGFDPYLANGQDADLWLAVLLDPNAILAAFAEPLSRDFFVGGMVLYLRQFRGLVLPLINKTLGTSR